MAREGVSRRHHVVHVYIRHQILRIFFRGKSENLHGFLFEGFTNSMENCDFSIFKGNWKLLSLWSAYDWESRIICRKLAESTDVTGIERTCAALLWRQRRWREGYWESRKWAQIPSWLSVCLTERLHPPGRTESSSLRQPIIQRPELLPQQEVSSEHCSPGAGRCACRGELLVRASGNHSRDCTLALAT